MLKNLLEQEQIREKVTKSQLDITLHPSMNEIEDTN